MPLWREDDLGDWWRRTAHGIAGRRLTSRLSGAALGLIGVVAIALVVSSFTDRAGDFPSPGLPFAGLALAIGYGWGWRIGFVTAVASFLALWYFILPPADSWTLSTPGDWTRLFLLGVIYVALAGAGGALRRVRRANAALAGTVDRLNAIITSMADGVMVTDRQSVLVQTNEAMRRIAGGEVPATLAERFAVWQTRRGDGTALAAGAGPLSEALRGTIIHDREVIIRIPSGADVRLSVSSAPLRDHGGAITGAVMVCRDITALRRLEQSKDDFLSVASHELKTPLTALRGYAYMLRQCFERLDIADERARRYLATIESQTRRMTELVDTLLDVSRVDAGRLQLRREYFDLAALVDEVAEQLMGLSERHPIMVEQTAPHVEGVWDRDRIEQVVVNLLTNAVRYSPAGGPIAITVGLMPASRAIVSAGAGDTVAFVRVRDQGIGLAPGQLTTIFERFHQAREADDVAGFAAGRTGMGLGLYIAHEIVQRHGGRIWAESDGLGTGATFTMTLPLHPVTEPELAE